jgi:hypothetical protein
VFDGARGQCWEFHSRSEGKREIGQNRHDNTGVLKTVYGF